MAVCADDEVTGDDDALLGEKGVLDAHTSLLEVVRDAELVREVPGHLGLLGRLDVLVRRIVVGDEKDPLAVEDAGADLAHGLDGDGRRDVVGEDAVEIALDELAGNDLVDPGVVGEDLLRHGHGTRHVLDAPLETAIHPRPDARSESCG